MTRAELTEKLLDIKREKGWSWKQICSDIGGMSPVLTAEAWVTTRIALQPGLPSSMPPPSPGAIASFLTASFLV